MPPAFTALTDCASAPARFDHQVDAGRARRSRAPGVSQVGIGPVVDGFVRAECSRACFSLSSLDEVMMTVGAEELRELEGEEGDAAACLASARYRLA